MVLAGCAALPSGDGDDDQLLAAMLRRGIDARWSAWDDAPDAELVVLRATWDYTERLGEFLAWARTVPVLANPVAAVAWNVEKSYLLDLAAAGVSVIATEVFPPGHPVALPDGEVVVKPAVGAGSRGAARFTDHHRALAHAGALHEQGRSVVVQPYAASVETAGETAMVLVRGQRSHAFRKGAMLAAQGAGAAADASGLFHAERLAATRANDDEWALAEAALAAAAEHLGLAVRDLLYARVDVLDPAAPRLLELELIEPSLGWRQVPADARTEVLELFVDSVVAVLEGTR